MNSTPNLRTIVEDKSFSEDLNELSHKYNVTDIEEVKRCIDWMLARNPSSFDPIPDYSGYYILKTTDIGVTISTLPSFRVVFRYNEKKDPNNVHLVAIAEVVIPEEEQ